MLPTDDEVEAVVPTDHIPRRSILTAAALAAPAIVLSVATPAAAASAGATLSVAFANTDLRAPGSSLADGVATVRSSTGSPVPNESVTFSVTGPAFFGNAGTTTFVTTTDTAGQAAAIGLTAGDSDGTVVLTATVAGVAAASAQVVVQTPTGQVTFAQPSYPTAAGSRFAVAGTVHQTGGATVTTIALAYAGGLTGPATASVGTGGTFEVRDIAAPSASATTGTITATSAGLTPGTTQVVTVGGYISFHQSAYRAYLNDPPFTGVEGTVVTFAGFPLPAEVGLTYPAGVTPGPSTVSVSANGDFVIPDFPATEVGGPGGGRTLTASASGLNDGSTQLFTQRTNDPANLAGPTWNSGAFAIDPGGTATVSGFNNRPGTTIIVPGGTYPLTYTGGYAGPSSVTVAADGTWSIAVTAPPAIGSGTITIADPAGAQYSYGTSLISY